MDQDSALLLAHRALPWHFVNRTEDPSLERSEHPRAHRHPAQGTRIVGIVAQNSTDVERSRFREVPLHSLLAETPDNFIDAHHPNHNCCCNSKTAQACTETNPVVGADARKLRIGVVRGSGHNVYAKYTLWLMNSLCKACK
jgi:hypothetical protein